MLGGVTKYVVSNLLIKTLSSYIEEDLHLMNILNVVAFRKDE